MKKLIVILFLSAISIQSSIFLNQIGYYPNGKKIAIILDTLITEFEIRDDVTKEVVSKGKVSGAGYYQASGEYTVIADFTGFRTPGTYKLYAGTDSSYSFSIRANIYSNVLQQSIRSYYFQRSSYSLEEMYAGKWARSAGHPDTALEVIGTDAVTNLHVNVTGGWYDAGDFGKYIVNAGVTCGTLLGLYELCPDIIHDNLNIPESGNGKSDLLDEVKVELDWIIRMQDADGGVFFKVGPITWPGAIMPAADKTKRYIIGKSTTSTLNFVAVMAMASRIYKKYDESFADNCLHSAKRAWKWACENRSRENPSDVRGTGPYDDGTDKAYKDEFFWAATELCISSDKSEYRDTVKTMLKTRAIVRTTWWQYVNNLGFYTLAIHQNELGDSLNTAIKKMVISYADKMVAKINGSAFNTTMVSSDFLWGSAGTAGNQGVPLAYAHFLTGEQKYLDALVMAADFLFGKNPLGYSFITGFGSKSPQFPHHRQCQADGVKEPVPGFVVGGPNKSSNGADSDLIEVIESGTPPAKCYTDVEGSWASNEPAINQNAPWVLILGYLEKHADSGIAAQVRRNKKKWSTNSLQNNFTLFYSPMGLKIAFTKQRMLHDAVISVYDIAGKKLKTVVLDHLSVKNQIILSGLKSSTIIYVKIDTGGKSFCKTVVCVK